MHSALLKNAHLLGEEGTKDIFVRDGLVAEIADNLTQEDVPQLHQLQRPSLASGFNGHAGFHGRCGSQRR